MWRSRSLSPALGLDAHSTHRFHREARALAALNHPNIASIYGFEEFEMGGALVLELVEGPTLADRIKRGAIPLREALPIARQIADALECAHEHSIVHRDLKPGNIKLRDDGTVKVLDFGLARFLDSPATREQLSTVDATVSRAGVVVGTLAYMSPEQALGATVDRRTDIWAFGLMLYEMLSGRRPFQRASSSDELAAIIKDEPGWSALPPAIPPSLTALLRRCLAKDPHDRMHAIADVRLELEALLEENSSDVLPLAQAKPKHRWMQLLPWVLLGLTILAVGIFRWANYPIQAPLKPSFRYSIRLPSDAPLAPASAMPLAVGRASLALSPDGKHLVYVALINGKTMLYLRDMERGEFRPLRGTEESHSPFFSPDGQWVGFFAHDKLKKVSLTGDQPITLCDATLGFGGTWSTDGQIYFSTDYSSGIYRVQENGGASENLTGEDWHFVPSMNPQVLPGDRAIIFGTQNFILGAFDLETRRGTRILMQGTFPRYSPTGHLLFANRGAIQFLPFDVKKLKVTGPPAQLLGSIRTERDGAAQFAFSQDGTLVFAAGGDGAVGSLVALDRNGNEKPLQAPPGDYSAFSVSLDGSRLAIPINTNLGTDIWLYDMRSGTTTRLTSDHRSSFPVWSADGTAIYYTGWPGGSGNLYRKSIATSEITQLTRSQGGAWGTPLSVTRDGKRLLADKFGSSTKDDLVILELSPNNVAVETPFLTSAFSECLAALSPDERWVAYTSDESGGWEVYVTSFPHPGEKIRISSQGGEEPIWSPNGREFFYRFGTKWFVADVTAGEKFQAGHPRLLFEGPFTNLPGYSYQVTPDGTRFLVVEGVDQTKSLTELNVVTNIFDEIRRRSSTAARQ